MFSCMFVEHDEFFFHSRGHAFCTISLNHVYPSLQGFAIDGTGGLSNSIPLRINEQRCRERIHTIGRGRIGIQVIEHWERVTFLPINADAFSKDSRELVVIFTIRKCISSPNSA